MSLIRMVTHIIQETKNIKSRYEHHVVAGISSLPAGSIFLVVFKINAFTPPTALLWVGPMIVLEHNLCTHNS